MVGKTSKEEKGQVASSKENVHPYSLPACRAEQADHRWLKRRMNSTGVGFAGIDGVWWLPAREPFPLPQPLFAELRQIGRAVFVFLDVVMALYRSGQSARLKDLLSYKVPERARQWLADGRVHSLRPDFQLRRLSGGGYQPIITELEICPSAHGFAHAMQVGYGLPTDLVQSFARFLDGRTFLFVGTAQWSEFLFEQLAFCRALAQCGASGRVLYDLSLATLADQVRHGQRWRPPMFGIPAKPAGWDDDLLARIDKHEMGPYLWPDALWPDQVGDAVVFRFGYCDCFTPEKLASFEKWQAHGATLLNPAVFILDSKVMMAALSLPAVRQRIPLEHLTILDRCIPETRLLQPESMEELLLAKDDWVVKYAGFDGHDQAWGGRSLQVGEAHSPESWRRTLRQALALPWPVVAQRVAPSVEVDVAYWDSAGRERMMQNGRTRLRAFFIRDGETAVACGVHVTVSSQTMRVAEGVNAVQAPVVMDPTIDK